MTEIIECLGASFSIPQALHSVQVRREQDREDKDDDEPRFVDGIHVKFSQFLLFFEVVKKRIYLYLTV